MSAHWPTLRSSLVDHSRLLEGITLEGELLVQSAMDARGDLAVPGRPGVTLTEAVLRTGTGYRRALAWIQQGEQPDAVQHTPEDAENPIDYHTSGRRALVAELSAHGPEEPCATWWPADRTYGFWRRRMAHETALHRIDVQGAIGLDIDPVDSEFAADGIDEILLLWFGHHLYALQRTATAAGAVGVETAGRAWLAILSRTRSSARRIPAVDIQSADAVITGDPMKVYLWLWGRAPNYIVETSGDYEASAQLWGLLHLATHVTAV